MSEQPEPTNWPNPPKQPGNQPGEVPYHGPPPPVPSWAEVSVEPESEEWEVAKYYFHIREVDWHNCRCLGRLARSLWHTEVGFERHPNGHGVYLYLSEVKGRKYRISFDRSGQDAEIALLSVGLDEPESDWQEVYSSLHKPEWFDEWFVNLIEVLLEDTDTKVHYADQPDGGIDISQFLRNWDFEW